MASPCSECKYNNTPSCTGPCETFKRWRDNPEEVLESIKKEELPAGVFYVTLNLYRDDVCAQDCMDLTRTMKVRSDRTMADIDDELRKCWLPKGYNWVGGSRSGTAGEYVRSSEYKTGSLHYTHLSR